MKTLAAILVQQKKPLVVDEIEVPSPCKYQVLVKVGATGVCGSQIGEIDGVKGRDQWLPHLLGHEAGGTVISVGPGVKKVKAGDHVVLHWKVGQGNEAQTPQYRWRGKVLNAGHVTTFQESTLVSENRLTKITSKLPPEVAALFGCCVTTGFGVVENDAQLKKGESVLILGCGGIGLTSIQAAKHAHAKTIIAVDIHPKKLQLAKQSGATHWINSSKKNVESEVARIMKNESLDVVIENTGIRSVIEMGYELCGPQGRVILVGVPNVKSKARIDTLPLHFGKVLTGSFGGQTQPQKDIPRLIQLYIKGKINLNNFYSKSYSLLQINKAIQDLRCGKVLRPMVIM